MAGSPLRETVLRAAVDHIAEHGPDGLSFRQVAAAAGVSHQAPYHHFGDRKGVFQAIALEGFVTFAQALREATMPGEADPAVAMLDRYVEFALGHRGHFRVMFRPDLNGLLESPQLQEAADDAFNVLVDHVERIMGPQATAEERQARVAAMWALAHGLATLLIDGALEAKLGPVRDRHRFVQAVAAQSDLDCGPVPPPGRAGR